MHHFDSMQVAADLDYDNSKSLIASRGCSGSTRMQMLRVGEGRRRREGERDSA
jgi:hypothetical protein